ncbi:hypothetical protein D8796_05665 [Streptococcus cristatus]|uniref:DUF5082 domain-containing protein n=1 Tax=Streptococcus cristatus TaxID=45634 RepID=A0A3R9KR65_STRCR|nr:DUF5082 family protein [Streptococcus cristatus]RSJ79521.1 hypothetical protein D8795_05510 [Streptococcus cristatus]RSJ79964.1 hypothetical protein D8796_05665 [Streptococcus cristatus]RSJ85602.1 hypothetical protein D8793_06530 [Streptococcus cristatus]RSJ85811.1 hypothetical protein D8794_05775 [Streptococcus cristatus]
MSDASYYQELANQESQNYNNTISQKAAVDKKIDRLEEAKTSLSTQINNFQTGIIDALEKVKVEDESQFKGDRKTKYVEKYDSANTAATTNKASHEANLDSINTEIANLQAESDRLAIDVKTAYENMNYYQSMANSASSE